MNRTFAAFAKVGRRTEALCILADGITQTVTIGSANFLREATNEWVTVAARGAPTAETSNGIGANGGETALSIRSKSNRTFINVEALFTRIACHANWTRATKASQNVGALGVLAALACWSESSVTFIDVLAIAKWVAGKSR